MTGTPPVPPMPARPAVVVAGIGNELRGDDAVGPAVLRRLVGAARRRGAAWSVVSDPLDLVTLWDGCDLAVVVDATRSGVPPGTVRVLELDPGTTDGVDATASGATRPSSTHSLGLATALGMARALGTAPRRVVLVCVEGASFDLSAALTPAVAAALPAAAAAVLHLLEEHSACA